MKGDKKSPPKTRTIAKRPAPKSAPMGKMKAEKCST